MMLRHSPEQHSMGLMSTSPVTLRSVSSRSDSRVCVTNPRLQVISPSLIGQMVHCRSSAEKRSLLILNDVQQTQLLSSTPTTRCFYHLLMKKPARDPDRGTRASRRPSCSGPVLWILFCSPFWCHRVRILPAKKKTAWENSKWLEVVCRLKGIAWGPDPPSQDEHC